MDSQLEVRIQTKIFKIDFGKWKRRNRNRGTENNCFRIGIIQLVNSKLTFEKLNRITLADERVKQVANVKFLKLLLHWRSIDPPLYKRNVSTRIYHLRNAFPFSLLMQPRTSLTFGLTWPYTISPIHFSPSFFPLTRPLCLPSLSLQSNDSSFANIDRPSLLSIHFPSLLPLLCERKFSRGIPLLLQ